jgi:hypothetical protein
MIYEPYLNDKFYLSLNLIKNVEEYEFKKKWIGIFHNDIIYPFEVEIIGDIEGFSRKIYHNFRYKLNYNPNMKIMIYMLKKFKLSYFKKIKHFFKNYIYNVEVNGNYIESNEKIIFNEQNIEIKNIIEYLTPDFLFGDSKEEALYRIFLLYSQVFNNENINKKYLDLLNKNPEFVFIEPFNDVDRTFIDNYEMFSNKFITHIKRFENDVF